MCDDCDYEEYPLSPKLTPEEIMIAAAHMWEDLSRSVDITKHQLKRLAEDDYVIVGRPEISYKGPNDTDQSMLRSAADRLEKGFSLGGGNLRATVIALLRDAANAIDASEHTRHVHTKAVGPVLTIPNDHQWPASE
jgi:hypothetical protein